MATKGLSLGGRMGGSMFRIDRRGESEGEVDGFR